MTSPRWACLMYHSIPRSEPASDYYAVSRKTFVLQLDRLGALGIQGVSLETALALRPEARMSEPVAAITFDDGYRDNFTEAFPELVARRMSATFFIVTSRVGTPGYATWDDLRTMRLGGMSIQSHTHTHPFLSTLGPAALREELDTSRRLLDQMLGQATTTLALPNGDRPRGWSPSTFADAGFRWVATSAFGPNDDVAWKVRRYTVRRDTTLDQFDRLVGTLPSALSREGLRLAGLNAVRSALGVSRYARWRRHVLRALGR